MTELVGYTGFVGSNIYACGGIDKGYNSKNIEEAYGTEPDILVYAGMRAEKYLANLHPSEDMEFVYQAEANIRKISPKKLVLISTIDVFKNPQGKNEDSDIDTEGLHAYGLNRFRLEQWAREKYPDALIIRLPALYGAHIKKNFIYDIINIIPSMIKSDKYIELSKRRPELYYYYMLEQNGFYKCRNLNPSEKKYLRAIFRELNFSALNFTDSRNKYQFYPLNRLWRDIQIALEKNLKVWHPATEPVSAVEIYQYLNGKKFYNIIGDYPVLYDYQTLYAKLFGKTGVYIMSKDEVLKDIKRFVEQMQLYA